MVVVPADVTATVLAEVPEAMLMVSTTPVAVGATVNVPPVWPARFRVCTSDVPAMAVSA